MVFELMEGGDLRKFIKDRHSKGMSVDMVISFTEQLLQATAFMHSKGFIHRDIKSHNIVLGEPGSRTINGQPRQFERVLKLADFGLSRLMCFPPKPMTKEIATLNWRAPEVMLDNMQYSQSVDMWSIGVVIYEMLTGELPFSGTSEIAVLLSIFKMKGTPSDYMSQYFTRSPVLQLYSAMLPKFTQN